LSESFVSHEKNGVGFFSIPSFDKTNLVVNAFSGRKGGISKGKYSSLNLSFLTEDKQENIMKNRIRFATAIGISPESMVNAQQVHEDIIYKVTIKDKGRGAFERDTLIPATDALMTNEKGITLMLFFADCVPVVFLDPIKKAIAVTHAGWKGTVAKIAAKTVKALELNYGVKPENILVGIGPSIGPCHYQVDHTVIAKVAEAFPKSEKLLFDKKENGYAYLNLWEANRIQLLEVGISDKNITVAGLCTYCFQDNFFSHRGNMMGRQAAVIMLK